MTINSKPLLKGLRHPIKGLTHWLWTPLSGATIEQQLIQENPANLKRVQSIDLFTWVLYLVIMVGVSAIPILQKARTLSIVLCYTVLALGLAWIKLDISNSVSRLGFIKRPLKARKWLKAAGYSFIFIAGELIFALYTLTHLTKGVSSLNTMYIISLLKKQWLYLIYVVIISPILEEMVFRQSIFNSLVRWVSRWQHVHLEHRWLLIVAAFFTGWIFAVMHGDLKVIAYMTMSIYLQWIYWREKDIKMNILTHGFINLFTVMILLLTILVWVRKGPNGPFLLDIK